MLVAFANWLGTGIAPAQQITAGPIRKQIPVPWHMGVT
jgi:hypothetical protein